MANTYKYLDLQPFIANCDKLLPTGVTCKALYFTHSPQPTIPGPNIPSPTAPGCRGRCEFCGGSEHDAVKTVEMAGQT